MPNFWPFKACLSTYEFVYKTQVSTYSQKNPQKTLNSLKDLSREVIRKSATKYKYSLKEISLKCRQHMNLA